MKVRKTRKPVIRAIPVRVTPVAAAVVIILSNFFGISLAADDATIENNASALTGTDEIVVTATRRDTSVQEVPYNLSAISDADIKALQIQDLSDIARLTPGLIQVDQGARNANQLIMRGLNASSINTSEYLRNTQGDRVGTYYGETPVYLDLKPIDLDRVEVLRGPQGTLYGSRSLGGTVRYIPKAPDSKEFTVDANGRTYGMSESDDLGYDGSIIINAPLIEDTLALRAMLGYLYTPGFIDQNYLVNEAGVSCPEPFFVDPGNGCTPDDLHSKKDTNDERTKSARFALLWNVTDTFDATLSWQYQDQEIGGRQINSVDSMALIDSDPIAPGVQPLKTGEYESGMRFLEENDRENNIYNLTLNYDAGDIQLLSTTSYTTYEDSGNRDQTDTLMLFGFGDFPAFSAYTQDNTDDDIFTQEIRLVSNNPDSKWDWIAGGFYQSADLDQSSTEFAPNHPWSLTPDDSVTYISTTKDTDELAFFGELGYQVTEKWHVLGGARWFDIDDSMYSCFLDKTFLDPIECRSGDGDDQDTLYKLSTDYAFTDALLGYALFSQGISLGGVNTFPDVPPSEQFVKPESVDNYEIGLRSSWFDNALIVNGAVYYMDWTDLQLDSTSTNDLPITGNGGGAETKGVELEARATLGDHWTLGLGYAYTSAELTDSCVDFADWDSPNKSCPIYGVVTEDGDRLPGTPEHQGNFLVGYHTGLSKDLALNVTYQMTTQSDVFTKLGDDDDCCRDFGESLSGFTIHSASIGLSGDTWDATLFADNMFDKYAETGVRFDSGYLFTIGPPNDFAMRRYSKNMITPRTIGINFSYHFQGE